VLRVGNYAVGDTISIINLSGNSVTLVNGISGGVALDGSSGHFCLYRFADDQFV